MEKNNFLSITSNPFFVQRSACPGCRSALSRTLCSIPYTETPIREYLAWYYTPVGKGVEFEYLEGSNYVLEECDECGLIYQKEIPGPELMKRLYERWIDPVIVRNMERSERNVEYYFWVAKVIAHVLKFLGRPPRQVAFLDFGMGWGNWCLMAKSFGCEAYGTELSDARTDHAKELGITVLARQELPAQGFDFINAEQVFEHIADPLETLVELASKLKSGGVIRIGVPLGWDVKRRLSVWNWNAPDGSENSLNAVASLQHINCFTFRSLVTMAQRAGLREVELPDYSHQVSKLADIVKMPLRLIYRMVMTNHRRKRRERGGTVYLRHQ